MGERADISSTDAVAAFRTALLVYISKVRPLLDDSVDEVFRMRESLRVERRVYWENRLRRHTRELADAQQALFSAQLSNLREPSSAETMAVQRARRAVREAEEKLRTVKGLAAVFEKEAQTRIKVVEHLRMLVGTDLPQAAHFLERILGTLDSYQALSVGGPAPEPEGKS